MERLSWDGSLAKQQHARIADADNDLLTLAASPIIIATNSLQP